MTHAYNWLGVITSVKQSETGADLPTNYIKRCDEKISVVQIQSLPRVDEYFIIYHIGSSYRVTIDRCCYRSAARSRHVLGDLVQPCFDQLLITPYLSVSKDESLPGVR